MKKALALAALALIGWTIGGMVPPAAWTLALGVLFGSMVGIPIALAALTTNKRIRHDVYYHAATESPREPQKQAVQLTAKATHYIVIASRAALPTVAQNKIEVKQ